MFSTLDEISVFLFYQDRIWRYTVNLVTHLSLEPSLDLDPERDEWTGKLSYHLLFHIDLWVDYSTKAHTFTTNECNLNFAFSRARAVPNMFQNNADDILARSSVETWVIKGQKGDVDVCKKCEGKVYEAEKLTTASVSIFL